MPVSFSTVLYTIPGANISLLQASIIIPIEPDLPLKRFAKSAPYYRCNGLRYFCWGDYFQNSNIERVQ